MEEHRPKKLLDQVRVVIRPRDYPIRTQDEELEVMCTKPHNGLTCQRLSCLSSDCTCRKGVECW